MHTLIKTAYAENVPNKIFINTTYDVDIMVNIDNIYTSDNMTYMVRVYDMYGTQMAHKKITNDFDQGEDQQQHKFTVKLKKTKLGFTLVKVVVELYRVFSTSPTENFVDSDTVAFMTEGISRLEPLPGLSVRPFPPAEEKDNSEGKAAFWIATPSLFTLLTLFRRRRQD